MLTPISESRLRDRGELSIGWEIGALLRKVHMLLLPSPHVEIGIQDFGLLSH